MQLQTCLSLIGDLAKPRGCVFAPGKVLRNHMKEPAWGGERRSTGSTWRKNNSGQLLTLSTGPWDD